MLKNPWEDQFLEKKGHVKNKSQQNSLRMEFILL